FCAASGQTPNFSKSAILFSKNVDPATQQFIRNIFPVQNLTPNTFHLGHPLIFSHTDRAKAYEFILNKFRAKLTTVKANKLNHAGRLTYINSVLASIPIYYMSTVLFTKTFIAKITSILRRFWWAGVQEGNSSSPFQFRSWDDICQSKDNGGLGIRDLLSVNRSLIINAAWNIATSKDPHLAAIIKAKYYPNTSFWLAKSGPTKSVFWASILQIKSTFQQHCKIQIHRGNSSIWSTPWCPLWRSIHDHLTLPNYRRNLPSTIAELWHPLTQTWNQQLISEIFNEQFTQVTNSLQVVPSNQNDVITWTPATKGTCTAKEAFNLLNSQLQMQLPQDGARAVTPRAMHILRKTWRIKRLPPYLKTFCWRLIRRALATGIRAGRHSTKISKDCCTCNSLEDDAHLFFHCTFARAVWFSAATPLCTSMLPNEQDGVQEIMSHILGQQADEEQICTILTTLWYIWRARNDKRFNNKTWTVWQVHHAVAAELALATEEHIDHEQPPLHINMRQGILLSNAGHEVPTQANDESQGVQHTHSHQLPLVPTPPLYRIGTPILLQGPRCYTDAATAPDLSQDQDRRAGLGVFIVYNCYTTYIKARMQHCSSVLMAEAAALLLAANAFSELQVQEGTFLSDNQQLVTYFNTHDSGQPPAWNIKHITQGFINKNRNCNHRIYKIARSLNSTAHILANQALHSPAMNVTFSCANQAHSGSCPLRVALEAVNLESISILAASCC
ncbi:uncharacterized protein LOC120648186, partial [Panicum virgatum]